jgi:uncharacterized membrane protein YqgA involved in biofilm formation
VVVVALLIIVQGSLATQALTPQQRVLAVDKVTTIFLAQVLGVAVAVEALP